jgi:hypothetical protein
VDREQAELEPPPDWRKDPTGRHQYRLWEDGWTENVSDFGVRAVDPYTGADTTHTATLDSILGPTPAKAPRTRRKASTSTAGKSLGALAVLLGALAAGIGTLVPVFDDFPRYTVNYLDLPGYEGRGLWVAFLAVAVALFALGILRPSSSRIPAIVALLLSTAMLVVVVRDWRDVDDALAELGASGLGVVSGLTLCLIGAVLAVLGSVTALVAQRR